MSTTFLQNKETIALDIGASKEQDLSPYFYRVIAICPDTRECLEISSVTLCPYAVFSQKASLFLGVKQSTQGLFYQGLKEKKDHPDDSQIPALTLKEIIHDWVYQEEDISERSIACIRCDVGGSEEHFLEDLFYFAYFNRCSLLVSFYPDRWEK